MKRINIIFYISIFKRASMVLAIIMTLQACKKDKCFKSTGKITTEERTLGDFREIILSGNINLYIKQDSMNSVTIEAGANLIPNIVTDVESGVLTIRNDNTCNWLRSFKKEINLYLHCRNLYYIEYKGAGNITGLNTIVSDTVQLDLINGSGTITLDVRCRSVRINLSTGCGDAEITGTTQSAIYYIRGTGAIRCSGLNAEYVYFDEKGTNDCYLNSSGELDGIIGYIGNVYYAGHPSVINVQVTERGKLIPLD